jgi:hypothetical protein
LLLVTTGAYLALGALDAPAAVRVIVPCTFGAAAYGVTLRYAFRAVWDDLFLLARGVRDARVPPPQAPHPSEKGATYPLRAEGVLGAPARDG